MKRKISILSIICVLAFSLTACSNNGNKTILTTTADVLKLVTSSESDITEIIRIVDSKITNTKELNNGVCIEFEDGTIFRVINATNNKEIYLQMELTFDKSWDDDKVLDYLYIVSDDYFFDAYKSKTEKEIITKDKAKYEYSLSSDDNKNTIIVKGSV